MQLKTAIVRVESMQFKTAQGRLGGVCQQIQQRRLGRQVVFNSDVQVEGEVGRQIHTKRRLGRQIDTRILILPTYLSLILSHALSLQQSTHIHSLSLSFQLLLTSSHSYNQSKRITSFQGKKRFVCTQEPARVVACAIIFYLLISCNYVDRRGRPHLDFDRSTRLKIKQF